MLQTTPNSMRILPPAAEYRAAGITELLHCDTSTAFMENLSEVQAVCQTILIISKGKLAACDIPVADSGLSDEITEAGEEKESEVSEE